MAEASLNRRFKYKLTSTLVQFILSILTIGIVPRALGPNSFGIFDYLMAFFGKTTRLFSLEFPQAYLTKLSQRPKEYKLIGFGILFLLSVSIILISSIFLIITLDFNDDIWYEIDTGFVFFAGIISILLMVSGIVRNTHDALGSTVKIEKIFLMQYVLNSIIIIVMYFTSLLNLVTFFCLQFFNQFFVIYFGIKVLFNKVAVSGNLSDIILIPKKLIINYTKEFYHFCNPLIFYVLVVFFTGIADRLILQEYSGFVEQGYYGLSNRLIGIIFLVPSAMSVLLLRDMSKSAYKNDLEHIKLLLKRYTPLFYFIAAYFAIFISKNAELVTQVLGGNDYMDASATVAVMSLYPLHQTYGQYGGAVLLAINKTNIIRNVGIITLLFGLILSFIFIAPNKYYGLNLGALGLSYKMILTQFFQVNIYLWLISKYLRLSFIKFIVHQFTVVFLLFIFVTISNSLSNLVFYNIYLTFISSGILYTIFVFTLLFYYPRLIAMNRIDINHYFKKLK